ncbi:zinc finger matrin-type protein 5-like [Bacillus rossius redtenbacheri]|uniref:zinc finger matrin-type protein 5-like n=1 Tax=Bacillus rossius redtenbacheri TaxID=93214 RepID=UPI002FDD301A
MGKRYYCDYCDRSFVDGLDARKKHLKGYMHARLRKEYYESIRDARTILSEESLKTRCRRFRNSGECPFGNNCKYTHFSPEDLQALEQQVLEEERAKREERARRLESNVPTVVSWLKNRSKAAVRGEDGAGDAGTVAWDLPAELRDRTDLPPSLQPLLLHHFSDVAFGSWG